MIEILWKASDRERVEYFWSLSDTDTQAFFDEYMRSRDFRLPLLKSRVQESYSTVMDFSPQSLTTMFRWVKGHIRVREFNKEELTHILELPDWFRENQLSSQPLSEESLILLNDVAYYFAEVFIRSNEGVHWCICRTKVKRHHDGNQPILCGFKVEMNPRDLVTVGARKAIREEASDDYLLKLYGVWLENLRKPPRSRPTQSGFDP
jgi:hypothetical protein